MTSNTRSDHDRAMKLARQVKRSAVIREGIRMKKSEYLKIEKSQAELHKKFRALRDGQLAWYENEALNLLGLKKLPKKNDDDLIRQTLGKSPNDERRKQQNKQYYVANVSTFLTVINELLTDAFIDNFSDKHEQDDLVIYNYYRVIRNLLFDSLVLLNEYSCTVLRVEPKYGCGKGYHQHNFTLYQSLRQSIFGQASFHSFIEVEPDLSISIIRQLVELRLRRGFGVLGWYDPTTQSLEPLPLSMLLAVLEKYQQDIDFSMPFDCLTRIYGWSNIFLHTGIKDCSWKHIFVKNYIAEFAMGKREKYSTSNGITLPKATLQTIMNELESGHPRGAKVITCDPQSKMLD